jgi:hypothetical protein
MVVNALETLGYILFLGWSGTGMRMADRDAHAGQIVEFGAVGGGR